MSKEPIYDVYSEEKQASLLLVMYSCTFTLEITRQYIYVVLKGRYICLVLKEGTMFRANIFKNDYKLGRLTAHVYDCLHLTWEVNCFCLCLSTLAYVYPIT